jgi:uncharacterized protein YceH (UPF0502 family)
MSPQTPQTPKYCRDRAYRCERLAEVAELPETREVLLHLASRWRALAEEDEVRRKPGKRQGESPAPE